jgi:putative redox protein
MGKMQCQIRWVGGLGFEAQMRDHKIMMDSPAEGGVGERGPSPKELLLASICGCSGIDVVSILTKMRVSFSRCEVHSETETTAGYPSIFSKVKLNFYIDAEVIKDEQALKAVELSMTKYCGVSAMVVEASPIFYDVIVNGNLKGGGQAHFSGALK